MRFEGPSSSQYQTRFVSAKSQHHRCSLVAACGAWAQENNTQPDEKKLDDCLNCNKILRTVGSRQNEALQVWTTCRSRERTAAGHASPVEAKRPLREHMMSCDAAVPGKQRQPQPPREAPADKKSRIVPAATLHTSNGAKLFASYTRGARETAVTTTSYPSPTTAHPTIVITTAVVQHTEAPYTSCDFRLFPRTV